MNVSNIRYHSELYETLAVMGMLSTEERRIREVREQLADSIVEEIPLLDTDINRVGYYNSHFRTNLGNKGEFEVWVGDDYINPQEIQWEEDNFHLYGILPRRYDPEKYVAKLIHNTHIVKRYNAIANDDEIHEHKFRIDLRVEPYASMDHPDKCAYYISDSKVYYPTARYLSETVIEFTCPYQHNIDVIVCSNLSGVFEAKAGQGIYIDNPNSKKCYHHIVVDQDPTYPIDARFYPCIKVDKDCMIRVYTDSSHELSAPEVTRLVNYPEFMDIEDPYNSDDGYLNELEPVDDVIHAADSEELILDKFSRIAKYCYRIWERYPFFNNEMSDFLMCDNTEFGRETFSVQTVNLLDGTTREAIITRVPFENDRDILFYKGNLYHGYEIHRLSKIGDKFVESNNPFVGKPCYVLPADLTLEDLTLLKFNAAEDTVINNIGEFIDENNMVILHSKLNRFYRNLLVLHGHVIDFYPENDAVRVSSDEPSIHDEHLWFELLTNVIPETFEANLETTIYSFGLDPEKIPESIKKGIYSLNLEPDDGPDVYTEMLTTYFKLGKRQKNYLALQVGEGVDDPRIQIFHEMYQGALPENPDLNNLTIHHPNMTETEVIRDYKHGTFEPQVNGVDKGEIFARVQGDKEIDDLLDGVGEVDAFEYNLHDISYRNEETGKTISGDVIRNMTLEEKKALVERYITDGDQEEQERVKVLWDHYMSSLSEDSLNVAVYKILLTDYVYTSMASARESVDVDGNPTKTKKYVVSLDEPQDVDVGTYWLELDPNASAPMIDEVKKHNLTIIMSMGEPDLEEIGALWIHIPAYTLQDYIEDIIGTPIYENGYTLPEAYFEDTGKGYKKGAMSFDYHAHRGPEDSVDLFVAVHDEELHQIHYGKMFDGTPVDGDIWYEFLEEIDNRVCYSDTEAMVIRVNERLVLLQFEEDQEITAFMFDDIVMNFRGSLGIRYISILADLINSGNIDLKDVNIFYRRLITKDDDFDPALRRLYTGRSHVVSMAKIDTMDYSIAYSSNIGRFRMDYDDKENTKNRERESAYRHVVDFRFRDFSFIGDRMALFVNGHYIPRHRYKEIAAEKIQLLDFPEVIACVDILYSKKDEWIIKAKKVADQYWYAEDKSVSIQRPEREYEFYHPIRLHDYTYKGYYDVLLNEYIFNGRLLRELAYLKEHPDEVEEFVRDMVHKFHAISDIDLSGRPDEDSRIIIPCFGQAKITPYTIKEGSE